MHAMPNNEHACNIDARLMRNAQRQSQVFQQRNMQSCKALCACVVKQIRMLKRPSSTKYLDALKESKVDEIHVSMCKVHSKKVVNYLQINFTLNVLASR
jgi:hypothetical protein